MFSADCDDSALSQWVVFLDTKGPLFCSFVQQHQLELRTSKTYSKRQALVQNKNVNVQNLEKILKIPVWRFSLGFFRHYETFLWFFWIAPKGLPFVCFDILQHNGCQKKWQMKIGMRTQSVPTRKNLSKIRHTWKHENTVKIIHKN